jgi:hypothetical protein
VTIDGGRHGAFCLWYLFTENGITGFAVLDKGYLDGGDAAAFHLCAGIASNQYN